MLSHEPHKNKDAENPLNPIPNPQRLLPSYKPSDTDSEETRDSGLEEGKDSDSVKNNTKKKGLHIGSFWEFPDIYLLFYDSYNQLLPR